MVASGKGSTSAPELLFPIRARWVTLARPLAVRDGVVPRHLDDGVIALASYARVGASGFRQAPESVGKVTRTLPAPMFTVALLIVAFDANNSSTKTTGTFARSQAYIPTNFN